MRTVQSQGVRSTSHPARVSPQRVRQGGQGRVAPQKPNIGLIKRIANALGITPTTVPQRRASVDRFQGKGSYDHIARKNLQSVAQGRVEPGRPNDTQLVNFLQTVS